MFNNISGTTITVTAPQFGGYILRSQSTYTHSFTRQDAAYTFVYDRIVEVEEPVVPSGQPDEKDIIEQSIDEVEIPEQEVPLAAPTPPLDELPQAGGVAPEMFYVIGLALVSAGAIINKRKII